MLTKEQKLAILSKAIDEGAKIEIIQHVEEQSQAVKVMQDMTGNTNLSSEHFYNNGTQWYTAGEYKFSFTTFYKWSDGFMEEDVSFGEKEDVL